MLSRLPGTEIVTVALYAESGPERKEGSIRKHPRFHRSGRNISSFPNTSGCPINADEAVRFARSWRQTAGLPRVGQTGDPPRFPTYLLPDPIETLESGGDSRARRGDLPCLPYINADPVLAKRLEEVGVATVMPLGSPIGSNRGLDTRHQIEIIVEQATVPVVVDAGLGAPSHAAAALELGADAVLVNTAIAVAGDPLRMATAFKQAVEAGRTAFECGMPEMRNEASASSPLTGFLFDEDKEG